MEKSSKRIVCIFVCLSLVGVIGVVCLAYYIISGSVKPEEPISAFAKMNEEPQSEAGPLDFSVTNVSWNRYITLEELITYTECGWTLPEGAVLLETRNEYYKTVPVFDHYDYKEVEVWEEYQSGTKNVRKYEFNWFSMEFEWVWVREPEYSTRKKTEIQKEAVYRNENVYADKYYYTIDRWTAIGTYETNGKKTGYNVERAAEGEHDPAVPYWPSVELDEKTREASRREVYYITGVLHDDLTDESVVESFMIPFEFWNGINPGDEIKVLLQNFNITNIVN